MNTELLNIKTDSNLLKLLSNSISKKISKEELLEQRASFVYGSMSSSSNITKAQVKKFLSDHDCK